jgi:O-antigen/teichoic acid export membrane protein
MSGDRSRTVARNARAAIIRTVAAALVSLTVVPLALRGLGTDGYGTFQVLASLASLVTTTDIGLGLALFTRVGQLSGAGQTDQIRTTVGSALVVISLMVLVFGSLAAGALAVVDVPRFLETPPALRDQVQHGLVLILVAFTIRMPLSVLSSAHGGLQISHRLFAWQTGGTLGSSIAMVAAAGLTHRIDAALASQLAVGLIGTIGAARLGCRIAPESLPEFRRADLVVGWRLLRSGFFFYLLQAEEMIIGGLDNVVIAKTIGVDAVAIYSVAYRIISLAYSLVYTLGGSFWAGVAHAVGHGDAAWIRTEGARLRRLGTLWMSVFSAGFVATGVPAIALWTGNRLHVDPPILVALGLYFACLGHVMIDRSILNGAGRIRQQIVAVGLEAVTNLALSIWLAHRIGYPGVAFGTLIANVVCSFVPLQYLSWKLVAGGERPRFWTRSLTTTVLSVACGLAINQLLPHVVSGRFAAVIVGGCASLAATLALTRIIVGRDGIPTLVGAFRRTAP